MTTYIKGLLKRNWQAQLVILRQMGRINITKPRPSHFQRAVVEHVCKPFFLAERKPTHLPIIDMCREEKVEEELNPFEVIIGREALDRFENSKLIAFFHENSMSNLEKFENKLVAKKNGMRYINYSKKILNIVLKGTTYEPVLVLLKSHTSFIFCEEAELHTLLSFTKKLQKIVLMAAIVENRFLNYNELQYYGEFKNIEQAQLKLLGTLNSVSQNLVQNINHHPSNLIQVLNSVQEMKKSDKKDS